MKNFDNSFLNEKIKLIAGTDEAGRGPLAGPVVAAAVIFSPEVYIEGVNDSKKLTHVERETLYPLIIKNAMAFGVSIVSNSRIDKINILHASLLAMKRAVNKLEVQPDLILIDGNKTFKHKIPAVAIVKGDSQSFAVAAASIIAKVRRDRIMIRLAKKYPHYNWAKNKGYPTNEHINSIKVYGATEYHRKSFLSGILIDKVEAEVESETIT